MDAEKIAEKNRILLERLKELGILADAAPLMMLAFVSLAVIPELKLTTKGLVDVKKQIWWFVLAFTLWVQIVYI